MPTWAMADVEETTTPSRRANARSFIGSPFCERSTTAQAYCAPASRFANSLPVLRGMRRATRREACPRRILPGAAAGIGSGRGIGRFALGWLSRGGGSGFAEVDGFWAMDGDQVGDGELERLDALAGDGRDREERELAALGEGGELFELRRIGDVYLGGDQEGGFGGQRRIEGFQFGGDYAEVGDGVRAGISFGRGAWVGDIYQVDDNRGAFD